MSHRRSYVRSYYVDATGTIQILFRKSDSTTSNFYGFYVIFTFFFLSDENNQMKNVKIISNL